MVKSEVITATCLAEILYMTAFAFVGWSCFRRTLRSGALREKKKTCFFNDSFVLTLAFRMGESHKRDDLQ